MAKVFLVDLFWCDPGPHVRLALAWILAKSLAVSLL